MSTINLHPPQTYSRLFRPWDTQRQAATSAAPRTVKQEPEAITIKTELASSSFGHDCDRDFSSASSSASSSSNSSKSCYEEALNHSSYTRTSTPLLDAAPHPVFSHPQSSPLDAHAAGTASLAPPSQHAPFLSAASDLYYAAAAAAAAAASTPTAVPGFGMDPFTMGLMEQEYARVMAEDAQLKALNSRKQRPKKFKCPNCDVAFSNNGQLKGHIRIHTGERPFKCDVNTCGKTFTRNEELTRHKRIHTGLRPYPCSACGKKFGRRDHLKKHMKTHMPQERQLGPSIFVPMYPYLYGY
ncbi:Krueppel-like factor 16 [Drosophila simulans]|uniref:GD19684 n=2 Tax=melanogaster subgroup TaxID=32351 RepID=B4QV07_DROSI|nr:Krueppel-like factor 16 [Drosophila simulans]XP_033167091.1 Krueppel-like factor 16 [Drosophila mauritiana]EDX11588.1 GD19684 [Drosophila simulans]KMZ01423.1 uncharacterized protein Dsimw501_GD19684 [Drosophila simulans]